MNQWTTSIYATTTSANTVNGYGTIYIGGGADPAYDVAPAKKLLTPERWLRGRVEEICDLADLK